MLTRVPLAFDLSLIAPVPMTAPASTPEVVLFVSCPCIGGGGGGLIFQQATPVTVTAVTDHFLTTTITTTVSSGGCFLGLPPHSAQVPAAVLSPATNLSNPRWCFPDPNGPRATDPTTPVPPGSHQGKGVSLPPFFPVRTTRDSSGDDLGRLSATRTTLKTCGFYYEGLTWQRASELLRGANVGTFLIRDSADPNTLYSLSVQTDRGPTSVRIHYADGRFRLDCEDNLIYSMPTFDCVVQLVEHYVRLSQTAKGKSCVWLDGSGKRDLRVRLYRPLYSRVPSLQHACRTTVNGLVNGQSSGSKFKSKTPDDLNLPAVVKDYLKEYPFSL